MASDRSNIAGIALLSAYADEDEEDMEEEDEPTGLQPPKDSSKEGSGAVENTDEGSLVGGRIEQGASAIDQKGDGIRNPDEEKEGEEGMGQGGAGASEASLASESARVLRMQKVSEATEMVSGGSALGIFDYGPDAADDDYEEVEERQEASDVAPTDSSREDKGGRKGTPGSAYILTPPAQAGGRQTPTPTGTPGQATPGTAHGTPLQTSRVPSALPAAAAGGGGAPLVEGDLEGRVAAEGDDGGSTWNGMNEEGGGGGRRVNGVPLERDGQGAEGEQREEDGQGAVGATSGAGSAGFGDEQGEDVLIAFLGPPVTEPCPAELKAKFKGYYEKKQQGLSLNSSIRNSKQYRNPYLMQQIVESKGIEEHATFFPKDIFDPKGFDKSDFYDSLIVEQRREAERKEAERRAKGVQAQVEFHRGGILSQSAAVGLTSSSSAATKPLVQVISGPAKVTAVGVSQGGGAAGVSGVKKSKWDKGAPASMQQTTPPTAASTAAAAAAAAASGMGVGIGAVPAHLLAAQSILGAAAATSGASGIGRGAHLAAAAVRAAAAVSAAASATAGVASSAQTLTRKEEEKAFQRRSGKQ